MESGRFISCGDFTNLVDLVGTADAQDSWRLHIRQHSHVDPAPVYLCSLVGGGQGDSRQSACLIPVQQLGHFECLELHQPPGSGLHEVQHSGGGVRGLPWRLQTGEKL